MNNFVKLYFIVTFHLVLLNWGPSHICEGDSFTIIWRPNQFHNYTGYHLITIRSFQKQLNLATYCVGMAIFRDYDIG